MCLGCGGCVFVVPRHACRAHCSVSPCILHRTRTCERTPTPTMQAVRERLEASEERARELHDVNARLEAHVADLESRKRPPLYQKKQVRGLWAAAWIAAALCEG